MSKVGYEKRNRIGYTTLNRPEALNALDDELNDAMWEVWADFNADDSVDVAIVTGAGKAFCSGADLKTFTSASFARGMSYRYDPASWRSGRR
jgi:enoyl-CoA hydratase